MLLFIGIAAAFGAMADLIIPFELVSVKPTLLALFADAGLKIGSPQYLLLTCVPALEKPVAPVPVLELIEKSYSLFVVTNPFTISMDNTLPSLSTELTKPEPPPLKLTLSPA